MTFRAPAWWRDLPGSAKFRLYTRVTLQAAIIGVVAALCVGAANAWAVLGIVVAGLVLAAVVEVQPGLATPVDPRRRRLVVTLAVVVFAAVWVAYLAAADATDDDALRRAATTTASFALFAFAMGVLPFARGRWWWLTAACLATALAAGETWPGRLALAGAVLLIGVFVTGSMLLTLGGMRIVDDLERARSLEARLRVADERLRFARDLHDVVGRGFSAVAVKSELAATLARAGEVDRATTEMDEVKVLAVDSMERMRELVRGYRAIDLAGEVAGARSLLAAVGCRLVVEGAPDGLPERYREAAAWVTREGTTNIVKHASASVATLAFGTAGMSLRNDGVSGEPQERSGLLGLAERVAHVGGRLDTRRGGDEFVLEVVWEVAA